MRRFIVNDSDASLCDLVIETITIPGAYTSGGVQVNSSTCRTIVDAKVLETPSGYGAEVVSGSISSNAFKVKIYYQTGASGTPLTEVADGYAEISGMSLSVLIVGK